MRYNFTYLLLFTLLFQLAPGTAAAAGITSYPKLNMPGFWQGLAPNGDMEIMDAAQIKAFNEKIAEASPSVCRLTDYPKTVAADQLRSWLGAGRSLEGDLYAGGQTVSRQYKETLLSERNLAGIAAENTVSYGVTLRRANLRALPSSAGLFTSPGDTDFDVLQETAVDPSEPLLCLHTSKSGAFYYVQIRNYRGWIAAKDIAVLPYQDWLLYASPKQFLVVTGSLLNVQAHGETLAYQMGAKIPLISSGQNSYTVRIPAKTAAGQAAALTAVIDKKAAVHNGFLPYTKNQIIAQSFEFLHAPYGWGGLKNSVDCSSFIADIYRTVGIELPRNADEQEQTAGIGYTLQSLGDEEKLRALGRLQPGDALFFDGHTMLYLGMTNNEPFIIHSLGSYTKHTPSGNLEKIRTMQVVVSGLSLTRYSGQTFLTALTSAKAYR